MRRPLMTGSLTDKSCTVLAFRSVVARLAGVMLIVLVATLPIAGMNLHAASHLVSAVDATDHHHHDERGAVLADHHDHDEAPADRDDGGHQHQSFLQLVGFERPVPAQIAAPLFAAGLRRAALGRERAPPEVAPTPPSRPPRLA